MTTVSAYQPSFGYGSVKSQHFSQKAPVQLSYAGFTEGNENRKFYLGANTLVSRHLRWIEGLNRKITQFFFNQSIQGKAIKALENGALHAVVQAISDLSINTSIPSIGQVTGPRTSKARYSHSNLEKGPFGYYPANNMQKRQQLLADLEIQLAMKLKDPKNDAQRESLLEQLPEASRQKVRDWMKKLTVAASGFSTFQA